MDLFFTLISFENPFQVGQWPKRGVWGGTKWKRTTSICFSQTTRKALKRSQGSIGHLFLTNQGLGHFLSPVLLVSNHLGMGSSGQKGGF